MHLNGKVKLINVIMDQIDTYLSVTVSILSKQSMQELWLKEVKM